MCLVASRFPGLHFPNLTEIQKISGPSDICQSQTYAVLVMVSPALGYFDSMFVALVLGVVAAVLSHIVRRTMGMNAGFRDETVPQKAQTQRSKRDPTKAKQACATRPFGQGRRQDCPSSGANDRQESIDSIDSIEGHRQRCKFRDQGNADERRRQELSRIIGSGLMASRLDERAVREGLTGAHKYELSLEEPGPVLYLRRETLT